MRYLLTILLSAGIHFCFAQQQHVMLKLAPLALIDDPSFPTIQAGIEYKLSKRFSWYNEAGIKYRQSTMETNDTSFVHSAGFKFKTECRYYYKNRQEDIFKGLYYAINFFLTRDRYNNELNYYNRYDSAGPLLHDIIGVKKNVWGMNILFGKQKMLGRKWSLDMYAGMGFRHRNIRTIHQEFDSAYHDLQSPVDLNVPFIRDEADSRGGSRTLFNFTAGIRFGYKF
ncbi:MAG: DUF3575 domain-containing protein [Ferruginibacter sp.]